MDTAFHQVVLECAASGPGRTETWINRPIREVYGALHGRGFAHSVECWEGEELVGGLYGVAINAAFFGESMFSRERDASKVALVHLVARLKRLDVKTLRGYLTRQWRHNAPKKWLKAWDEGTELPAVVTKAAKQRKKKKTR